MEVDSESDEEEPPVYNKGPVVTKVIPYIDIYTIYGHYDLI